MADGVVARIGAMPRIPDVADVPSAPDRLSEDATGLDVARAALSHSVSSMLREDGQVRLGKDPEAVHDARVAARRIRSYLKTFRPLLDRGWADGLREELRWFGAALGGVRDAEVLRDRLWSGFATIDGAGDAGASLLVALESRRVSARQHLLAAMTSPRYGMLLERLVEASREPRGRAGRASRPAQRAPELMARPWKRLRRSVKAAEREPSDDALHRIRIDAKQVRYAAEALTLVVGGPARAFAGRAEAVQDVLGEHQDAVTAIRWLSDRTSRIESPEVAFAAGRVAQIEAAARAEARAAWPVVWRSLQKRKRFWT